MIKKQELILENTIHELDSDSKLRKLSPKFLVKRAKLRDRYYNILKRVHVAGSEKQMKELAKKFGLNYKSGVTQKLILRLDHIGPDTRWYLARVIADIHLGRKFKAGDISYTDNYTKWP